MKASDEIKRRKNWPQHPRALSNSLRRLAPNLRAAGVVVSFLRTGKKRFLTLEYSHISSSSASQPPSEEKPTAENKEFSKNDDDFRRDDGVTQGDDEVTQGDFSASRAKPKKHRAKACRVTQVTQMTQKSRHILKWNSLLVQLAD